MGMCDGGVCLNKIDWICGFENNDDLDKVGDCFTSIVRRVPPWVKLDVIRKFCGVSLAQFTGNETLGLAFPGGRSQAMRQRGWCMGS
jgi:hypothetical protein